MPEAPVLDAAMRFHGLYTYGMVYTCPVLSGKNTGLKELKEKARVNPPAPQRPKGLCEAGLQVLTDILSARDNGDYRAVTITGAC